MSFKTTIVIAVLLLLVGGYAYYFEYKGAQKKEEAKQKEKTLFEVKKDDVAKIKIEGIESGPVLVDRSDKENWKITQPLQARADSSTVDRILSAFETVKYKEIIEEQPKDLSAYELDKPKMTIEVSTKANSQRVVHIGAKNPIDNVYYIRVDKDPRVYLAEGTIGDLSTTTLLDLRDKKLTDFVSDKVQQVQMKTAQLDLQFQKVNDAWKMMAPVQSPASESEISSLLSSLENLRATTFIDQPDADLSTYGLTSPLATVELVLEKGLRQKMEFGKTETETYCRVLGNPGTIAAVGNTLDATFEKKIEDWREKKVLVLNRFDAEEIRFVSGGKEYSFKKGDADKWNQLSPAKGEVEYDQIQGILEKLELAEISRYGELPDLGSAPSAEIFITTKNWEDKVEKKHLAFGPVEENVQAIKNDEYGVVVFAPASLLQEFQKAVQELKAKPPAPGADQKKK